MLVHKHLKTSKDRNLKYKNENAKEIKFEVGDPVYLKQHVRKSKLDRKWEPYYRIVKQKSPLTYTIRNQLDGQTKETHARHLRLANLEWKVSKPEDQRRARRAKYVISPPSSDSSDLDQGVTDPLVKLAKRQRKHRSGSSSEDDIPLLELANRLKARNRRVKQKESRFQSSSSSGSSSSGSSDTDDGSVAGDLDLELPDREPDSCLEHMDSDTESYSVEDDGTSEGNMEIDLIN
jgi:hypothetical protein